MRFRTFLSVFLLCFLLTGCGAVEETETAISQIGNVTMDSLAQIEEAERLYAELPLQKQSEVSNSAVLFAARQDYDAYKAAVDEVRGLIGEIGEVTLNSGKVLLRARCYYDALDLVGFGGYLSQENKLLKAAEDQYVVLQTASGMELLEKKQFEQAYELFRYLLDEYSECPSADGARTGAADALTGLAEKEFKAGRLDQTLYALEEITARYGTSEAVTDLRKKLTDRLEYQRPQNGRTFKNTIGWGNGEFTAAAGDKDAYVKLEDITDSSKYILFYVRAGEETTVKVRDGRYVMKYATGEYWFNQEILFGRDSVFSQAEETMDYTTIQEGSYTYYGSIFVSLYSVPGGQMETTNIGQDSF